MKIREFDVLKGDGSLNDNFYHKCLLQVAVGKAAVFTDAEQKQLKEYRAPDGKNIAHLFMKSILLSLYEESSKEVAVSKFMLKTFPSLFKEKDTNGNTPFEYLLSDEIMKDGKVGAKIEKNDFYNEVFLDVLFVFLNKGESIEKCTSHNSVLGYLIKNESKAIPLIIMRFLLFMLNPLRDTNNALKKWNIARGNFHSDKYYTLENNSNKTPEVAQEEWNEDKIRRSELNTFLYSHYLEQIEKEKAKYQNRISYIIKYIWCVSNNHEMEDLDANFNPINTIISLVNNQLALLFNTPQAEFNQFNQEEITFLIQALINAGAKLDLQNTAGNAALILAAQNGHTESLKALVNAGAKLDIQNKEGETALILAVYKGHTECVKALINAGAKLDLQDDFYNTALIWAAEYGYMESVQFLINAGAKLDLQDEYGDTALIWAAYNGHTECVRAIVDAGAKLDLQDDFYNTALIWAARNGRTECVQALVNAGANVNIQDKYDNTALIWAAYNGHTECVKALVEAGAKLDIQNTAGNAVCIYGNTEIAAIIEKRTTYKLMLKSLESVKLKPVVAEAQTTRVEQNQENNAAEYQCTSAAIQSTGRNVHSASGYQKN